MDETHLDGQGEIFKITPGGLWRERGQISSPDTRRQFTPYAMLRARGVTSERPIPTLADWASFSGTGCRFSLIILRRCRSDPFPPVLVGRAAVVDLKLQAGSRESGRATAIHQHSDRVSRSGCTGEHDTRLRVG